MKIKLLLLFALGIFITGRIYSQSIVITEIMYNDPSTGTAGDSLEYLEFYNNTADSVDMTGYQITTPVTYTFPGLKLANGAYAIVARYSARVQAFFGITGVMQWTTGNLTNGAASVVLKSNLGVTIDSVRYNTTAPWPTAANGLGSSLMLCNPNLDNNVGGNWVASSPVNANTYGLVNNMYVYGTPGSGCIISPAYVPVYVPVPFTENFDSTWINANWFRDVPDNHWINNPVTGNNSWRRNDDGVTSSWTNAANGAYATPGANSSIHSARFHSANATNGTTGILDLYSDFTTPGFKRLSLWYLNSSGTDSLAVFVSYNNGTSFTFLQKFITTASTAWEQKQIDLGTNTSSQVILRFKASATGNSGTTDIGLDEVSVSIVVSNDDAGITAITRPASPFYNLTDTVKVNLKNFGTNDLTSVWLNWSVNGVLQTPAQWTGTLSSLSTLANVTVGSFTFPSSGLSTVKVWTSQPNNGTDPNNLNDTLSKNVYYQGYATIPFWEHFDSIWVNKTGTREAPSFWWMNSVMTGNTSIRRDDDGTAAAWTTTTGAYTPAGAGGTIHSARFHSASAGNGGTSNLDLYLNFNTPGYKRLQFWYINTSGTDSLALYMSVNNGANFSYLTKYITSANTTWEQKTLDLGNSVSGNVILRFKPSATNNTGTTDIGFDEVNVFIIPPDNAGISVINNPPATLTTMIDTVKVTVKNFGGNQLTSATVNWSVNGVLQTPQLWTGNLAYNATSAPFSLGPHTFAGPGFMTIKAWTSSPNGGTDPDHTNDTLTKTVFYQNFALIPYYDNFDSTWVNKTNTRDVYNFYWANTPATGNSSWRRNDDGAAAAWTNATTGAYTPVGAISTIHSARFHSAAATAGASGIMDLFLNFNNPGYKRLKFYYINTSGTDSMAVYMSSDSGATYQFLQKYTTVTTANWELKQIDLGNTNSPKVILRFKATNVTSGTSDIGLDEVQVVIIPNNDAGITAITEPVSPLPAIADSVKVSLKNFGGSLLTSAWINWTVNGVLQTPYQWIGTLAPSAIMAGINLGQHSFSGPGLMTIKVWTSQPNNSADADATNDTLSKNVYYQYYAPIPFIEHFDSLWTSKGAIHDVPGFYWLNTPNTGNNSWRRADDGATAAWTNPATGAYTPTGANSTSQSARFHTAGNASGTQGTFDVYLDFTTPGMKELRFYYINTTQTDSLAVWMSTNGGASFSYLAKFTTATAWTMETIQLGSITFNQVVIRFRATANNAGTSDIGVDEVEVKLVQPDAGILSVVSPVSGCGLTANEVVSVKVKNFGLLPITNVPVSYKFGTVVVNGTITSTMQPGDTVLYTFATNANLSALGAHPAKFYTGLTPDDNHLNDTISQNITNIGIISTFPFSENFETGGTNYFLLQGAANAAVTVEANIGLGGTHGMRMTGGLAGTWPPGSGATTTAALAWSYTDHHGKSISCMVNGTTLNNPELILDLRQYFITTGGNKYSWFRVLINDTVQIADANSIMDFNPVTATADSFANHVFDLVAFANTQFKVTLQSACKYAPGGTYGLGDDAIIDNLIIRNKPSNDMAVTALTAPVSGCGLGNENITVNLKNFGLVNASNFLVKAKIDAGSFVTALCSTVIMPDSTLSFTFPSTFNFSIPGPHAVTVVVSQAGDANFLNDTIHGQVINTPFIATFPYFQNYEGTAFTGWSSGFITTLNEWVLGTPAKATINTAYSGVNSWLTGLTGNYNNNTNSYVLSPCFNFTNLSHPFLSVYLNFVTQNNTDAMVLEAIVNDSAWFKVGDSLFYNNYSATAPVTPPKWAGTSNGWTQYGCHLPNLANKAKVVFRFRFQTNGNQVNEGVAIDDFYIGDSLTVAVPNLQADNNFTIYPNPANLLLHVNFNTVMQNAEIKIITALGEVIYLRKTTGAAKQTIDISGLPAGIYGVMLQSGGKTSVKKLVKY